MSTMHATVEHAPAHQVQVRDQHEAKPQPIVRDHRDPKPQPIVRDHRDDDRRAEEQRGDRDRDRDRPVIIRPAPVVVTSPGWTAPSYEVSLMGATSLDSGQLAINTMNRLGGATSLEIENAGSGSTYVTQVATYDANGSYQVINVNQMISAQNPAVRLPLDNCASITRVVISGHSDWGGAIALEAA